MTTNYYTTIEQSKKLLELDIKPETADMIHYGYYKGIDNKTDNKYYLNGDMTENDVIPLDKKLSKKIYNLTDNDIENALPCWSFGRILSMIPNKICHNNNLSSFKIYNTTTVEYEGIKVFNKYDNLFDNVFDLFTWLLTNEYLNIYCIKNNEYYSYTYTCHNKNMLNMIGFFLSEHEKEGVFISHYIEKGTNKDYLFNTDNISIKLYVPNNQNLIKEIVKNVYLNQWIDTDYVDIENFSANQIIEGNRKTRAFINNILMINEDFYNKIFND